MAQETGSAGNVDEDQKIVPVDENLKGQVIGKGGRSIQLIKNKSGAFVETCDGGFRVCGSQEQRECAKEMILEIVKEVTPELVNIPDEYKGIVIGTGGQTLNKIKTMTGVRRLFRKEPVMTGPEENKQRARLEIKRIVAQARLSPTGDQQMMACCFVDDFNLPDKCDLSFIPIESKMKRRYRLKLSEDDDRDDSEGREFETSRYLEDLKKTVSRCLSEIKKHIDSGKQQHNDMWCHFGTVFIDDLDEGDESEKWTLKEVSENLIPPKNDTEENDGKAQWHAGFKEGVNFDESCLQTLPKYACYTRHDLNFLTPSGRPLRCKVWVRETDDSADDEEIPDDVKNVLEEIHFKDERTNARCKGRLCCPSMKRLKADIAFPACDFDCRLTIRTRDAEFTRSQADKEQDLLLVEYLSYLTLADREVDELPLPKSREIPANFYIDHRRRCKRSLFSYGEEFTIIVSKETSFRSGSKDGKEENMTDLHMHCKKWDEWLRSGTWEPQDIVEMLPKFWSFVKKVHSMVLEQGKHTNTECDDQ